MSFLAIVTETRDSGGNRGESANVEKRNQPIKTGRLRKQSGLHKRRQLVEPQEETI